MRKKITAWLLTALVVTGLVFPPYFGFALEENLPDLAADAASVAPMSTPPSPAGDEATEWAYEAYDEDAGTQSEPGTGDSTAVDVSDEGAVTENEPAIEAEPMPMDEPESAGEPASEGDATSAGAPVAAIASSGSAEGESDTKAEAGKPGRVDAGDEAKANEPVASAAAKRKAAATRDGENASANLADFLIDIICNAPVDENGDYVVDVNDSYELSLSFGENEALQFDNDADLVYGLPGGLSVPDVGATTFDINIVDDDGAATISGNAFRVSDGKLVVRFNQDDPNIERLKALANVAFSVDLTVRFVEGEGTIVFGSGIEKDFVFESNSDLAIEKRVAYESETDTANYVLTVKSVGNNTDVKVQDTVVGTALKLNHDVTVESNVDGLLPLEVDYTDDGKSFIVIVPEMENGEELTITYSAAVNNSEITAGGTVGQTRNVARVSSEQVPDGKEAEANFAGKVQFHQITKSAAGEAVPVVGKEDSYEQTWTIEVNKDHKMDVGGTYIYDWIAEGSRPFMQFTGDGISVEVTFEDGSTETRQVAWGEALHSYADQESGETYGWAYSTPGTDGKASYVITCKTLIDASSLLGNELNLRNGAQVHGAYVSAGVTLTVGKDSVFGLEKRAIGSTSTESEWELVVHVDAAGYPELRIIDDAPRIVHEGKNYLDAFQQGSLDVAGLLEGEAYQFDTNGKSFVIDFFQDEGKTQPGLKPTANGESREITIRFKTSVNQDWLNLTDASGYERYPNHVNRASARVGGNVRSANAYVTPKKESIKKEFAGSGSEEINGITYPVFHYKLTLHNPEAETADISDVFDRDYLKYHSENGITISGGTGSSQGGVGGEVSARDRDDGIDIHVSQFPVDESGKRYPAYTIRYSLIVKDEAALNALNKVALEQDGYGLRNAATWNSLTSNTVEVVHTYYPYVDKELVTKADAGNGYVAEFKLIINKYAEDLDPTSDVLYIQDVLSPNLRLLQDSLSIKPAAASIKAQFDSETNTLTLTDVPDNTTFEVTYRARVLGKGNVTYSNTVRFGSYERTVEERVEVESSGAGSGSNPSITLVKRDAEDLGKTLGGATFQLFYLSEGAPVPVTDKNGQAVFFTTAADGTARISGNQSTLGWTLWEGRTYQLVEVSAPAGYEVNDEPVEFVLAEIPSSQLEYALVGDRIDVSDNRIKTELSVSKEWVGAAAGSVTIGLLANGEKVDEAELNSENGWQRTFAGLDKYSNGEEIAYTVEEEPIAGYVAEISGSAEEGYVVTNTEEVPHIVVPESPITPEPIIEPSDPAGPTPGITGPDAPGANPGSGGDAKTQQSGNVSKSAKSGGFFPKTGDNVAVSLLVTALMLVAATALFVSAAAIARRRKRSFGSDE